MNSSSRAGMTFRSSPSWNRSQSQNKFVKLATSRQEKPGTERSPQPTSCRTSRIRVLTLLHRLRKMVERQQAPDNETCECVDQLLQQLQSMESRYGEEMQTFFKVLRQLLFADQSFSRSLDLELSDEFLDGGGSRPYFFLIGRVLSHSYGRAKQIQRQAEEEAARLKNEIEQERQKVRGMLTQMEQTYVSKLKELRQEYQSRLGWMVQRVDNLTADKKEMLQIIEGQKRRLKEADAEHRQSVERVVNELKDLGVSCAGFEALLQCSTAPLQSQRRLVSMNQLTQ